MTEHRAGPGKTGIGATASGKRLSFAARHEWTLVGLLAILVFIMGCAGYAQTMVFAAEGGDNTWWDIIYASLQLFIFEGPDETSGWPLHLQLARALAPVIVLYAAAAAIWSQVDKQVALYRLLFYKRRFVVVCGVGETGYRIARDYCLNSDKQVVVIDLDPSNAMAAELEYLGAIVVNGNAMDTLVLMNARAVYAKEIFLCTSDDKANIAIAKGIERLTRQLGDKEVQHLEGIAKRHEKLIADEPPNLGMRCFMCVDSPDLYEVFSSHSFFESNSARFALRVFNRRETIARNIFRSCAPDLYYRPADAGSERMHILFIGFQALGREMILQTALTAHYTDFRLPKVSVLCPQQCREQVARFQHRYPHLDQTIDIDFIYTDALTINAETWQAMQSEVPFSVCYVAMKSDVEGILTARRMNRLRRLGGLPALNFVVCLNQQNFVAEIIDDDFLPILVDKSLLPEFEPIEYFETLDETISIDVVVNEALDMLASTMHKAYVQAQLERGDSIDKNASLSNWSDLPEHKKRANRHAAAHIDVKLRIANCIACELEAAPPEVAFPPDQATLESLAQLEHRRWMADKYLAGYSYGEQRDEDRMLHPDLISWEELSEADKDKDRDNILQIPELLRLQQQKVCCPD
jgi:hypothetical protein